MKKTTIHLLATFALGASASALACPDFRGTYRDSRQSAQLVVTQDACTSVTFAVTSVASGNVTSRTLIADGESRDVEAEQARVAYRWEGNRLAYAMQGSYWHREGSIALTASNDLRDESEYRSSVGDNNRVMRDDWIRVAE